MSRYHAASRFDPSTPFGGDLGKALAQVKAKTLIMPSMTDRTLPTYLARELYRGIKNATYVEIPSYLGHLAGGPANEASAEYVFDCADQEVPVGASSEVKVPAAVLRDNWLSNRVLKP